MKPASCNASARTAAPTVERRVARLHLLLKGAVQGLGIRPAVFRLARRYDLTGWVRNSARGVEVEVEGSESSLRQMLRVLERAPLATDVRVMATWLAPAHYDDFVMLASDTSGRPETRVLPDRALCGDCLAELFDERNRRYRYPFINCTRCGPRYSIIEQLPYDRERTAMRGFQLCAACLAEYQDPADRRFHAQPNACAQCGPQVDLWAADGRVLARRDAALGQAAAALRRGEVLAVKGLGGFQLLVDARNAAAVARLRRTKQRSEKPFALMCPDEASVASLVTPAPLEWSLLRGSEAPIVLLRKSADSARLGDKQLDDMKLDDIPLGDMPLGEMPLGEIVAPGYADIGIMLPNTPLHHLLLRDAGFPVVVTSGNRAGERMCHDEREVLQRLAGMADYFLVHDRPIVRAVDDSVVRVIAGAAQVQRSARGYAPQVVPLPGCPQGTLAVGGHQKNTVALAVPDAAVLSAHIGDLDSPDARAAHGSTVSAMAWLYGVQVARMAADQHPDYASSVMAQRAGLPLVGVQHHYAHALSGMADSGLLGEEVLAVVWDGSGYGDDGTLWGGEFLTVDGNGFRRAAHWRPFPLPGGTAAVREPCRVAFSLLFEVYGERVTELEPLAPLQALAPGQRQVLLHLLKTRLNTPLTSSVGRLFDAVAALLGLCQRAGSEGHAACLLEARAQATAAATPYPVALSDAVEPLQLDWAPLLRALVADLRAQRSRASCAARFQRTLVEGMLLVARRVGRTRVLLSGGCFQNRSLAECAIEQLREAGFEPHWHQRVPPNDGGLALGQLLAS